MLYVKCSYLKASEKLDFYENAQVLWQNLYIFLINQLMPTLLKGEIIIGQNKFYSAV